MKKLEQYYKGDESWNEYSSIFGDDWLNSDFQKSLLKELENRMDLAKVIYYHIGNKSLDWIKKELPILDGLTPIDCLESEETENRLKVCLMRMH